MALIPVRSALRTAIEEAKFAYASDPMLDAEWRAWTGLLRPRLRQSAEDSRALVNEAYLTFNRTLRGFAGHEEQGKLMHGSRKLLLSRLDALCAPSYPNSREAFDTWHEQLCKDLVSLWEPVFPLSIGQAQKWVNILLKYQAAFGPGSAYPAVRERFLDALHTPIDNIVYNLLQDSADVDIPNRVQVDWVFDARRRPRWSRIENYARHYLSLQRLFRSLADEVGIPPCSIELVGWNAADF